MLAGRANDKRRRLAALLIVDGHYTHKNEEYFINPLKKLNTDVELSYPNATDYFCIPDIAINKPAKSHLKKSYSLWASGEIAKQLDRGVSPDNIMLPKGLGVRKPLLSKWIVEMFSHLKTIQRSMLTGAWKKYLENIEVLKITVMEGGCFQMIKYKSTKLTQLIRGRRKRYSNR